MIKELVKMFEKTLNKNSKFYIQDLSDYSNRIKQENKQVITEKYNRLSCLSSKSFENNCDKYTNQIKKCFLAKND
jgi:hypothetical protein